MTTSPSCTAASASGAGPSSRLTASAHAPPREGRIRYRRRNPDSNRPAHAAREEEARYRHSWRVSEVTSKLGIRRLRPRSQKPQTRTITHVNKNNFLNIYKLD